MVNVLEEDIKVIMDIDIDTLVPEVQLYPSIWNIAHEDYKDKNKKDQAWITICETIYREQYTELDEDKQKAIEKSLKAKWKNLRDSHLRKKRELKKIPSGSGSNANKRKYHNADILSFLDPTLELRDTESSLDDSGSGTQIINSEEDDEINVDDPSPVRTKKTKGPAKKKSPVKSLYSAKRQMKTQLEKEVSDYISCVKSRINNVEENDDLNFFKSLLPAMKDLTLDQKFQFRMKVMTALNDVRHIAINSLNVPPSQRFSYLPNYPYQNYSHSDHSMSPHSISSPPASQVSTTYPHSSSNMPSNQYTSFHNFPPTLDPNTTEILDSGYCAQ